MPSNPLKSRRAKILKNLQRQLETITLANSYSREVHTVSTNVKNWMETPQAETPIIYIIDETTKYNYHPGKLTERIWNIALYVVMKNETQLDLEEFLSDIEECLMKNITLSFDGIVPGPASHIRIREIITDRQLFSEIEGAQLAKINIDIIYTACVDNIR